MTRREVLKHTALALGYSVSGITITAVLQGCQGAPGQDWSPVVFSKDQVKTLTDWVDIIIPPTDTPGASDVNVHRFIDELLSKWADEKTRTAFLEGFDALSAECKSKGIKVTEYLSQINQLAYNGQETVGDLKLTAFRQLKEWTITGYFTSAEVGMEVLAYDPIPGIYDGDYPLSETGGKAWSVY